MSNDATPEVFPCYQTSYDDNGQVLTKRFKPLAYMLLSWIKMSGYADSIDISDDENSSQYEFSFDSLDGESVYKCYFNTYEKTGLISFCIYYTDEPFEIDALGESIYCLLSDVNNNLSSGQFQLVGEGNSKTLRYYSAVDLEGIASTDPDYEGPYQIHPLICQQLFANGVSAVNNYIDRFIEALEQ